MRDAQKFREQAARLREEACASSDLEVVEMLNDVAALFERLAAFLLKTGRAKRNVAPLMIDRRSTGRGSYRGQICNSLNLI